MLRRMGVEEVNASLGGVVGSGLREGMYRVGGGESTIGEREAARLGGVEGGRPARLGGARGEAGASSNTGHARGSGTWRGAGGSAECATCSLPPYDTDDPADICETSAEILRRAHGLQPALRAARRRTCAMLWRVRRRRGAERPVRRLPHLRGRRGGGRVRAGGRRVRVRYGRVNSAPQCTRDVQRDVRKRELRASQPGRPDPINTAPLQLRPGLAGFRARSAGA